MLFWNNYDRENTMRFLGGVIMENRYMVGEIGDNIVIKIIGNATMKNSKTLEDYFKNILQDEKKEVILDFSECNYIDSTTLGVIARMSLEVGKKWNTKLYEVNVSNMIRSTLNSTGIYDLMGHSKKEGEDISFSGLKNRNFLTDEEKAKHILEAHRTLVELSKENEAVFSNVVRLLEKNIQV